MKRRFVYLAKNGFRIPDETLFTADKALRIAENTHLLGLKCNMTGNNTTVGIIQNNIEEMCLLEEAVLPSIIDLLAASV